MDLNGSVIVGIIKIRFMEKFCSGDLWCLSNVEIQKNEF